MLKKTQLYIQLFSPKTANVTFTACIAVVEIFYFPFRPGSRTPWASLGACLGLAKVAPKAVLGKKLNFIKLEIRSRPCTARRDARFGVVSVVVLLIEQLSARVDGILCPKNIIIINQRYDSRLGPKSWASCFIQLHDEIIKMRSITFSLQDHCATLNVFSFAVCQPGPRARLSNK